MATKSKKGSKKSKGSTGRPSAFSGKRITRLVKENPRRKGSAGFKSFSIIKSGMSYEQFLAAGGRRQDLAYDVAHKHVKVA